MSEKGPPLVQPDDGRYVIEEKVAAGGMGVIYRVLDRSLGRTVAMKVCAQPAHASVEDSDAPAGSAAARARFLEEAQVTAQLDHPGIVPVHELGVSAGDQVYFTMPLVKGRSLSDVFALARAGGEGWNLSRAVAALVKVCQAVAYAHSKGIIHRDLKPANVMVGRFGEVYVLDWGLAKVLGRKEDPDPRRSEQVPRGASSVLSSAEESPQTTARISSGSSLVTEDGTVLGTPVYMPPEQAAGSRDAVDERSDVYALGAMLYELLTGQVPYVPSGARVSPEMVVARIQAGPPKSVREIDAAAPAELAAVCDKAMAREPARRYASAFDLAEDLQAYLDHRVVAAYRTGAFAEIRAWCYRHRTLLKAAALVAIVLTVALVALNWILREREARQLVARAREHITRHAALREEIPKLQEAWVDARMAQQSWTPAWYREDEIKKHRAFENARREFDSSFHSAVADFSNAERLAPPSAVRREAHGQLEELYFSRYQDITRGEMINLSPEYYRQQLVDLDPEKYGKSLDAPGRIAIGSEPPGAEVYCFRYEEDEDTRLLPRPFDPAARRTAGEPLLRVAAIWKPEKHQGIFAVGDRLLEVQGQPTRTLGDLARALEGLGGGEKVEVILERRGSRLPLQWTPFSGTSEESMKKKGRLLVVHEQLGLSFEGYPLDFLASCRLGETKEGAPLTAELPKGSYVLVLRKQGYRDTRLPVVIPWRDAVETVRLLGEKDIPPGFVYVPAGPFSYGGDPQAFQSRERGEADVHGFFIARFEVTFAEYLEFLNDPEVNGRIDPDGHVEPASPEVRKDLADDQRAGKLLLVPAKTTGALFLKRDGGKTWAIDAEFEPGLKPTSPVISVSQLAAREYAYWRSAKDGRWRYRLPDDLEWEKAARGVDRRTHVWGEYLIWSFCWSAHGVRSPHPPTSVGIFAADESVYGVRDLAGSMDEHTSSRISQRSTTRRGGNWSVTDSQNLRAANRNGRVTDGRGTETGFRLVAELPSPGTSR